MSEPRTLPPEKRELLNAILAELETPEADLGHVLARHYAAQQTPVVQEMLRRAALPRRFDEPLYRDLLCDGFTEGTGLSANPPAFNDFIKLAEVQRLPRDSGYCLRDDTRSMLRAAWRRDDRDTWRRWHRRIADYLLAHRADDTAGQLFHLVLAHASEALTFFVGGFDAADARFDLAKCFSLLAVLDEVQEDLGEGLAIARLIKQQRYGGRALFASEYYRANVYQERPGAREAAASIVDRKAPQWILHVFATGGMGKTAFLRWLIARQLVPAGVACARVDFDLVNTGNVASYPWLLLIPFAEQLNAQLPRQYFTELLKELRAWESLLDLPKSSTRAHPAERLPAPANPLMPTLTLPDRATTDRFVRQFASILREAQTRTLLVLDTLESLTRADQIVPVYRLLADLHRLAPHLRCVLAGRYNVPVKVAAASAATEDGEFDRFVEEFSANSVIHEIARFTDAESRRYLHARGVHDEDIIDAIVRKVHQPAHDGQPAGSNPFTLALVTELVLGLDAKGLTRTDIEALPSARFVYLVDRVIRRIPNQSLRWVVRYGALPRRLTPAYIEAVLLDPLKRALRGELTEDQLGVRPSASGMIIEPDVWKVDLDASPTVDGLWRALSHYESPRGWIWRTPGAGDAIQFHGDVVDPMRDLLWHQGIFRTLQRASIEYFERLALSEPAHWADWICEAIFHTFQLEGDNGAAYWLQQLKSPQADADPAVRRQIAREVLRREYAEDEQTPMCRDGGPLIISKATLARAHVETARAILAVSGYVTTTDPDWQDLEQHVRMAAQLSQTQFSQTQLSQGRLSRPMMHEAVLASVDASRMIGAGKHEEAAKILTAALARTLDSDARFSIEYQLADTLALLRRPEASTHYREAIRLHRGRGRTNVRIADLQVKLASWYQSEGYHLNARDVLRAAHDAAEDPAQRYELRLQLAWSALKAGDYDAAYALFGSKEAAADASNTPPEQLRLAAWICLAIEDPRTAEAAAQMALRNAGCTEDEARALDLLGRTHGELMRFSEAAEYWERAIPIFTRTTAPLAIESCLIDQIAMHTRATGNYKEAAALIAQAERLPGARDAEISCRIDTERLFVLVHMGQRGQATAAFKRLSASKTRGWPAALRARIMAAGFALDLLQPDDDTLARFRETLDEIRPATARTEIADLLRTRATPLSTSPYWRQRFLSLFPVPDPKKDSFVARALRVAEMHRLFDSRDTARTLLSSAMEGLISSYNPWGMVRALEGLARLDALPRAITFSTATAYASASTKDSPLAEAIVQLHRLKSMLDLDTKPDEGTWTQIVAEAERGLAGEHTQTRWHAWFAELKAGYVREMKSGDWNTLTAHVIGALEAYRALGDTLEEQRVDRDMPMFEFPPTPLPPPPPRPTPPRGVKFETGDIPVLFTSGNRLMGLLQHNHMKLDVSAMAEELQRPDAVATLDEALTMLSGINSSQPEAALALSRDALAALPWEWTRPSQFIWRTRKSASPVMPEVTRWIQRALNRVGESLTVDGIYGPSTVAAMTRFVQAENLPVGFRPALARLRKRAAPAEGTRTAPILVVAPHEFGHKADETTFASTGIAPAEVYRMFGGRTGLEVLREPSLSDFQDAMRRVNPAVVHIVCSLTEVSGLTHLGFSRRDRPSSELMAAPTLHRLLLSNSSIGPLLVLDITRPSSTWEAASCLLRRNQFATDLFHLEGLPGILATGVAQPFYQSMRLEQCIASSLVPGKSMRELVTTIRSEVDRTKNTFDHLLAYTGAVLFTAEPELPCLQT